MKNEAEAREAEAEEEEEQDRDGVFFRHRAAIAHPKPQGRKTRYRAMRSQKTHATAQKTHATASGYCTWQLKRPRRPKLQKAISKAGNPSPPQKLTSSP